MKILENIGFDGFVNFEDNFETVYRMTSNTYGFSGIGVFDKNNLIEIKKYKSWEQIKSIDEIKCIRDSQIKELKYLIWKKENICLHDYSFLTKKEIKDIIDNFDFEKENKNFKIEEQRKIDYFKQKWLDWAGTLSSKQSLEARVFQSFLSPIL